jgi:hypothetical protein
MEFGILPTRPEILERSDLLHERLCSGKTDEDRHQVRARLESDPDHLKQGTWGGKVVELSYQVIPGNPDPRFHAAFWTPAFAGVTLIQQH